MSSVSSVVKIPVLLALTLMTAIAVRAANRLEKENSPYLLQHAKNPIDRYAWGPEAFEKAKKEGKPIFLSVGYSSCHWCHVMARESFEDTSVAAQLNEKFVRIKVDREERPDVDRLYQSAVEVISGPAGWPLSAFLTPEGKPFHGGSYFPRTEFSELVRKIGEDWSKPEVRAQIESQADRVTQALGTTTVRPPTAGSATPALVRNAARN